MKNLILSGGGDMNQAEAVDRFYCSLLPKEPKILYLPTAWHDNTFSGCHVWFSEIMKKYSIENYSIWTEIENKTWNDINAFDSLYIGGGNTFKLLHLLQTSDLITLIKQFIETGKPVYGGSAGAILLGKDIGTAALGENADENKSGISDFTGLDEIHGYAIQCHYLQNQNEEIATWTKEHHLPVIALGEDSGLYVTNTNIEPIGSTVTFF